MRSEQEMLDLILQVAEEMPTVRAVCMNGSRVNPNVAPDHYRDYDIVYLVEEMVPLIADPTWVDVFGERIIMQTPEDSSLFPPSLGGWYTYLMQFADGNRIDLMLVPLADLERYLAADSLTVTLLDKDGRLPPLPPPAEHSHYVTRPTAQQFADCCNEFCWVAPYVAKGLLRGQLLYAVGHLNEVLRPELMRMLGWQLGCGCGFAVNVGAKGKHLQHLLPAAQWSALAGTLCCDSPAHCRQALFTAYALFGESAQAVSQALGYPFPPEYGAVERYLHHLLDDVQEFAAEQPQLIQKCTQQPERSV